MFVVLSPAKNLDYESASPVAQTSQPVFLEQAQDLVHVCRQLSVQELASLMKISDKLAALNVARFGQWQLPIDPAQAKQAIYAFNGDVYTGLDAYTLAPDAIEFAQQRIHILSGLYGLLRPLDLMLPYRLEMGTRLQQAKGKNLYEFWGDTITNELNQRMAAVGSSTLVNLASQEYFKSVKPKLLQAEVITPVFKDFKNGDYKVISFYAKKARGMMARYIAEHQLQDAEALKAFDVDGYRFHPAFSSAQEWVFTRDNA